MVQKLSDLGEFEKRGVKLIALSCESTESHHGWIKDILAYNNLENFTYPIIADPGRDVATLYGMMDPDEKDAKGLPLTARAVFVIGPGKKLKLSILYPATTGRNFEEIIRVIDSLQLTATKKVATPVDWKQGGSCMVVPGVKQEDAAGLFPKGVTVHEVPSGKVYIRTTPPAHHLHTTCTPAHHLHKTCTPPAPTTSPPHHLHRPPPHLTICTDHLTTSPSAPTTSTPHHMHRPPHHLTICTDHLTTSPSAPTTSPTTPSPAGLDP